MAIAIVVILFVLTVSTLAAAVMVSRRGDTATQERLGQFVGGVGLADEKAEEESGEKGRSQDSVLTQKLEQVIEERGLGKNISTELARADLKITVSEYWSLIVISMIASAGLTWLIYGGIVLPLLGFIAGFFLPRMYVKYRQRRRLKRFNDQLGDGITLMANGLRAGYSLLQAMDAVGREMPPPISLEFRRVVREIGLGIDNDRAFNNLLRRVPSDDLDLMVTAVNVQQEVGGNLAEILEIIGYVIRERIRIKGEIQVLTAQGQLSGYVISGLPIAMGLLLYAMNKEYIGRMFLSCDARGLGPDKLCSQPCGWVMMGVGAFGIITGFYAIQKIIDIDV